MTTPTGHSGGLVQLKKLQQCAATPPILAAGGRRRPTAASAASRRRPQNLKKHDPFKEANEERRSMHGSRTLSCELLSAPCVLGACAAEDAAAASSFRI